MRYRNLGRSDMEVSSVCMGCWAIAGGKMWGPQEESDAIEAIRTSLDAGVNFFDTAEGYGGGESERLLGKGLGERRKEAIVATKVSPRNLEPEKLRAACESSLKDLKTDVIDLYQIHWPNWDIPIDDSMGAMQKLKDEGKIRAIGVSNFGKRDLSDALSCGRVESDQLCYSLVWRAVEYEVQPLCVENDVGILCYSPLAQGLLTGKYESFDDMPPPRTRSRLFSGERETSRHGGPGCEPELAEAMHGIRKACDGLAMSMGNVALAWLLAQPAITSVIAGARNADQARANAGAAEVKLPLDVVSELDRITQAVKEKMGANCDPWQSESRIR